uniref:NADH-ubiquinone oxidoreductase chain 2 n=1 Tax=Olavius algarvensis TaxID=188229 RepID=A0A7R9NGI0_9ANNE|nr:ND2 CDS [Olavius algarvensis]
MNIMLHINMMMYMIIFMSTIMAISSTNMLMMWFSLELNMFAFIPLIMKKTLTNETEASINYFMAQALGSITFLLASTMLLSFHWLVMTNNMMLTMSMLMKIGAVPCHYWYPLTMEMMSWTNCLLLLTWQKIAPLFILLYIILYKTSELAMTMIVWMNALAGGLMGLSQKSIKKIMAYSSITHMGWMFSGPMNNTPCMSVSYFIVYSSLMLPLSMFFYSMKMNEVEDIWQKQKLSLMWMIMISLLLLSLAGLPPLTGFIPKLTMMNMLLTYSFMTMIVLISGSLLNLIFYLNIMLNMLMSFQENMSTNKMKITLKMQNTILAMSFLALFIFYL